MSLMNRLCSSLVLVLVLSIFFLFFFSGRALSDVLPINKTSNVNLQESHDVLSKAADYCEKLKNIALFFICDEDITEIIYDPYRILEESGRRWNSIVSRYLYDYQLIRKDGSIRESRTLLRANDKRVKKENANLETKRFWYKYIVFGPLGMFERGSQSLHSYTFEKEVRLWGRPAIIIKVAPKNQVKAAWLYGRVWLDKDNGSTLKVEWEGEAMSDFGTIREIAKNLNAKPIFKHFAEYEYEKNGIRFPSFFGIREEYEQVRPTFVGRYKLLKSELKVIYQNYKFFTVDTEVR